MSSSPKEIIFEAEARELLYAGIKKLANVVAFTLGPRGRNVGLEKSWGAPTITNDGNSIVKDVILENEYENMGVAIAKEAVQKIKDKCGDGTTTTTILLKSIVENGIKQIAAGASPINIKRGIDKSVAFAIEEIKKSSIAIKDSKEIRNIAIVSASGDQEIGNMIADAMEKVGKSGVITIEEAKGTETTVEVVEGMQFDRGYISAYFCTNMDKGIAELSNPKILLVDKKISNIHEILPILSPIATQGAELLIIAEDIDGDALTTLVINKLRGTLKVVAVKAPGFGDRRKAMLQDIAVLTGGAVVSEETGLNLNEIPLDMLGSAERIIVSKEYTTIVNGHGQSEEIKARIKQLEHEISANSSSYDKEKLEERKAKLGGGVAVIKVGALTETEMKLNKQKFEDSLNSTKAALEEGIVPGGGVALLRASQKLADLHLSGEEEVGKKIVMSAFETPFKQIVSNSGCEDLVILSEVKNKPYEMGFNALSEKIENMVESQILDPTKVVTTSITLASSAAGVILLTEALISDAKEEETT